MDARAKLSSFYYRIIRLGREEGGGVIDSFYLLVNVDN